MPIFPETTVPFLHALDYIQADGGLTADGTTLVVDAVNHRVGIGTASPSTIFDVNSYFTVYPTSKIGIGTAQVAFDAANLLLSIGSGNPGNIGTTSGSYLVAIGASALKSNTSGGGLVAIGPQALFSNTSGGNSIAIGTNALLLNDTADDNIAIGGSALESNVAAHNLAVGRNALLHNETGDYHVAIGLSALKFNVDGQYNTAIGANSLLLNVSGIENIGIGLDAGLSLTGSYNTVIGALAALSLEDGNSNTLIGQNVAATLVHGGSNLLIGAGTDVPGATTSNFLNIGNTLYGDLSAKSLRIGAPTPTARLHLPAGATGASLAPLKFTTGPLQTTAEAGAVEFLTDDFYSVITTGAARKKFVLDDGTALTATRVPFATTNGRLTDDADMTFATDTLTVTGLVVGATKLSSYNGIATVKNGLASEIATIDSTGLTANVGATTLYAVPASGEGMYRVSAYLVTTTAGSVSSTMPNAQVVYTDKDSNTSVTLDVSPILGAAGLGQSGLLTANTVGTVFSGSAVIYVKLSTTIQYQTVNYASTAAGMAYALRIRLEAI